MRFIYTKTFAIFCSLLILVSLLVVMQVRGLLGPVSEGLLETPRLLVYGLEKVTVPVKNIFSTIYQLHKISRENSQLENKILLMQQQLVQYDQLTKENQALKSELGFVQNTQQQTAACTVFSNNPFSLPDTLVLNCGTDSGISPGMAVISQGYLVGKIIYAAKNSSTALLITSSNFSTDAMVSKSGAEGVVKGSFGSDLIMDQLSQQDTVAKGDLVVSAGINSHIPKNILIGQAGEVISSSNDVFKRITLSSPIDFGGLEFVFVVK